MKIPIELTKKYNREIENIEVIGTIPLKVSMKISSEIYATDYKNIISNHITEKFKEYFYQDLRKFIINEIDKEQNHYLIIQNILDYIKDSDRFEVKNKDTL